MENRQIVLAIFPDESRADAAVESLKAWDGIDETARLDAIGVLVLDSNGRVKAHKVGSRSTVKGVGIGAALALLTPVGLAAGLVGGAVAGALHHKGLGMPEEASHQLEADLAAGKAAVGVLADPGEIGAVTAKLTELGGAPEVLDLDAAAMAQAAADTAAMFGEAPPDHRLGPDDMAPIESAIPTSVMQD